METRKKSNYSTIVLVVCGAIAIIGVAAFGTQRPNDSTASPDTLVNIWGTISFQTIAPALSTIKDTLGSSVNLEYKEVAEGDYEDEMLRAIAAGEGPDLFLVTNDTIGIHSERLYTIPYESYPVATFNQIFIDQAKLFRSDDGIMAFPVMVDPMVLYYNKAMFASNFILNPPEDWSEFRDISERLTLRDGASVDRSGGALGSFENIQHAKEILSLLIMQTGNTITTFVEGAIYGTLGSSIGTESIPEAEALEYFTSFLNPDFSHYSWNSSLPDARTSFLAEDLGMYIGFASEASGLKAKNPNLQFSGALMPQIDPKISKKTFGKIYGFAISKQTDNFQGAYLVGNALTQDLNSITLANSLGIMPPIKAALALDSQDEEFTQVLKKSVQISDAWTDPDPKETADIFKQMVNDVNSGSLSSRDSYFRAAEDLSRFLDKLRRR